MEKQKLEISNGRNIDLWKKIIFEDEFDDKLQNQDIYNGQVSGIETLKGMLLKLDISNQDLKVLDIGCGCAEKLPINVTHFIEPCELRSQRSEDGKTINSGWCENTGYDDGMFDILICWGVMTFVRSMMETLMEYNRVVKMDGNVVFDVVLNSTMPIAQTVNGDCFVKYLDLFGFKLLERTDFGPQHHRRMAVLAKKYEEFDFKRFKMPQSGAKINNYLEKRDWFMR